jgi:hypothetical protein
MKVLQRSSEFNSQNKSIENNFYQGLSYNDELEFNLIFQDSFRTEDKATADFDFSDFFLETSNTINKIEENEKVNLAEIFLI